MAAFIFLQPLVGLAIGRLGLDERVGALGVAGALLIVAGVVVAATLGERERAPS
jgi:drug/metabolite transporter (DMT)-like permease